MGNDQMMLGLDSNLNVVTNDTGASAAGRHRASVRIGQRYLLVWRGKHDRPEVTEAPHLLLQLLDLLSQPLCLGLQRFRRLLSVGRIELLQVTGNALLNLSHAPFHLGAGEVLVAV